MIFEVEDPGNGASSVTVIPDCDPWQPAWASWEVGNEVDWGRVDGKICLCRVEKLERNSVTLKVLGPRRSED